MLVKSFRLLAAFLFLALAPLPALAADITVFGAASLSDALKDIAAGYQAQSGKSCRGVVCRLVRPGAPDRSIGRR